MKRGVIFLLTGVVCIGTAFTEPDGMCLITEENYQTIRREELNIQRALWLCEMNYDDEHFEQYLKLVENSWEEIVSMLEGSGKIIPSYLKYNIHSN